ncbi:MAG: zf-TFIIB domain-containing protein, partial [Elusimicrobiota bacterium]
DLFSTHPPLSVRLKILLGFAKENISVLQKPETPKYKIIDEMPMWWVAEGAKWLGPYSIDQIKVIDGISPLTWICKDGTNEVRRLKDEPGLSGFFPTETVQGEIYLCPRCNRNLVRRKFEETSVYFCIYCKGHLVSEDNFLKILVRQDAPIYRETIKEVESLSKKDVRGKSPSQLDSFPQCRCPKCGLPMAKVFHSYTTFIVVDKCKSCDLIWFDEKELEYINSLVAL